MKRIIALTTALITQLYYICKTYLNKQKKRKLAALISTLQVLSPTQLAKKFSQSQIEALQLVKGHIYPGQACYSVLNKEVKVAYSKLFQGQFRAVAPRSQLLKITEPSFMELREGPIKLKLYQTHNSIILPTRIMKFKSKSFIQNILETVRNLFNGVPPSTQLQPTQFYGSDNVYELFLPQGNECTILGKFGKEGKQVICNQPEMIFQNQKQMIRFIQQSIKSLNALHILLAVGFIVCSFLLLKQLFVCFRTMKRNVRNSNTFATVRQIFQTSRLCTLCKQNLSCIYYPKCKHMTICQQCQQKSPKACPQCKQNNSQEIEMFVC